MLATLEADSPPALADVPRLGAGGTFCFATGGLAVSVAGVGFAGQLLQYYFNQVAGIAPLTVGAIILVSMIFDGLIDPLVGWWSDNLRTPLGRRHPFMYAMAILAPLSFYFLWNAPRQLGGIALVVFMLAVLPVARVSSNLFALVSGALVPELAPGYNERTRFFSYWIFFSLLGSGTLGVLLNAYFLRHDDAHPLGLLNRQGYEAFGLTGAVVLLAAILLSTLGTQRYVRHLYAPPPRRLASRAALREVLAVLSHRSLIVLLLSSVLGGIGGGVASGLGLYISTHFWGLQPQDIAIIGLASLGAAVVGTVVAPLLSGRFGKKPTMLATVALSSLTGLAPIVLKLMGLMPPNGSALALTILVADAAVATTLGVMAGVISASMVSDIVEDNAVKTGFRSEGLMFAALGLTPKIVVGVGAFGAGLLLAIVHFPLQARMGTVPFALMRHLVLLYLPANVVLTALSIAVLFFYKIDRGAHEKNLAQLREVGMTTAGEGAANSAPF